MRIETPAILFDFKKNRIRIHKNTLRVLNYPDYVLLLINPSAQLVAVKACDGKDARAHRVPKQLAAKQSFEIYSSTLMSQLRQCSLVLDENETLRVMGNHINHMGVVQFEIKSSSICLVEPYHHRILH